MTKKLVAQVTFCTLAISVIIVANVWIFVAANHYGQTLS